MKRATTIGMCLLAVATATGLLGCGDEELRTSICPAPSADAREMEEAKLYFEYQSTDNDTGIHGLMGGAGWAELCITAPDGIDFLLARPRGQLESFGLSDLFFESREPPAAVMSQAEVIAQFPEGEWQVTGTTFDGAPFSGMALLTHDIPRPPVITGPEDEVVVDPADVEVTWEPVVDTVDGDPIVITGYEIIVTNDDKDGADPNGMSQPILSAHLVPSARSLRIPEEFFEPDTTYELEVIAIEESGNQTITVHFFHTP